MIWIIFFCKILLIHLIILYNREELECVFDAVQGMEETVLRQRNTKDNAVLMWKVIFLVCMTVPGMFISVYDNNRCFLNIIHLSDSSRAFSILTLFFCHRFFALTSSHGFCFTTLPPFGQQCLNSTENW